MALASQICLLFIFRFMSIRPISHIDFKERRLHIDYGHCNRPLFIAEGHMLLI
jgi:hypothetical protein